MRDTPRPVPTRDLDTGEIAEMVRRYYADVTEDGLLRPTSNGVAQVDCRRAITQCFVRAGTPASVYWV